MDGRLTDPAASNPPLARKLNLRDGMRVWFLDMPEDAQDEIDEYALELTFVADPAEEIDAAHIFVTARDELERLGPPSRIAALRAIKAGLDPRGILNPGKLVTLAPKPATP